MANMRSASYRLRKRLGFTQTEFAKVVGKTPRTVNRWEGPNGITPIEVIIDVCNKYGLDPTEYSLALRKKKKTTILINDNGERFPLYVKYPERDPQDAYITLDLTTGFISTFLDFSVSRPRVNDPFLSHPFTISETFKLVSFRVFSMLMYHELIEMIKANQIHFDRIYQGSQIFWAGSEYRIELRQSAKRAMIKLSENFNRIGSKMKERKIIHDLNKYLKGEIFPQGLSLEEYAKEIYLNCPENCFFPEDLNSIEKISIKLRDLQSQKILENQSKVKNV